MTREFRQCWAHHPAGMRCTLRAGHPADHVHKTTWPDQEATPGIHVAHRSPAAIDTPIPYIPVDVPEPDDKCVACFHKHRGRECGGKCQCKEFIG